METIKFEIGQWVSTEDGYGQILYIRPFYVEEYEINRLGRKNGEFMRYIFICKILCNFQGKIKKSKRIIAFTSISKIDNEGIRIVNAIKKDDNQEYIKYIFYDDKIGIRRELFLGFRLEELNFNRDILLNNILEINRRLFPSFTYKEFATMFCEYEMPFKLSNLIEYGSGNKGSVGLRFDSNLYKVKDKEAVFDDVRIFFQGELAS
ncbi:MAG: hypothetical protein H7X99_01635 [Saprospiraceae bacterium]|nr:hypothetical protein [Saprospiraceae bacterium]